MGRFCFPLSAIGGMIFDPKEKRWLGNEHEVWKFPGIASKLTLISPKDQADNLGAFFSSFLFRSFSSLSFSRLLAGLISAKDGMVFDPETMTWKGNEQLLDLFDHIETTEEQNCISCVSSFTLSLVFGLLFFSFFLTSSCSSFAGFQVGNEFILTSELVKSFMKSEEEHKQFAVGWFSKSNDSPSREYLNQIRTVRFYFIFFFFFIFFFPHELTFSF
jgi:hypothetical protein